MQKTKEGAEKSDEGEGQFRISKLGVGQENVAVVLPVGQENVCIERNRRRKSAAKRIDKA